MIKRDELEQPWSCLNRSQPDEPIFVICARDSNSSLAVMAWVDLYIASKGGWLRMTTQQKAKVNEARNLAGEMAVWALQRVEFTEHPITA